MTSPPSRPLASLPQSTVCVLLLGVLGFAMSLQFAVGVPPLVNSDEQAHASYAISLAHGVLPTIDTPDPTDGSYPQVASILFGQDDVHREIWTANHPPLFYTLCVPVVWLGNAVGHPGLALLGMRLLNALGYAASIVLVGLLARELVPRRRVLPVLASAMLLCCGAVPFDGGSIYNDGVGTATAFLTLLLGFRMVRIGVTRERVVWAAVAGVAAASTRSTGLVAVLILGACVLAALWLRDRTWRTFRRGVVTAVWIGLAPVVVVGWFYVRNAVLYGDVTGSAYLFEKFGRTTHGTTLYQLVNPEFWGQLVGGLWADEAIPRHWIVMPVLLLIATVAGLTADHVARQQPRLTGMLREVRLPGPEPSRAERLQQLAVWGLMAAYVLIVVVNVAAFTAGGGWLHARYALPLLPVIAIGTSLAVLRLGRCFRLAGLDVESADLRITLVASVTFIVIGMVCHADVQQQVDGPTGTFWLVGLVASDVLLLAVAAYVVRQLRRRLQPAVFGLVEPVPESVLVTGLV